MKINEFVKESFQTVSINGILRSLNNDEKRIYTKVKENDKILKSDLNEFDQRVASNMVTKGLLCRRKNPQHEIYFTAKGRRKCGYKQPIDEIAPPDTEIEKWINDNKDRFKEKYGEKKYKKYLYGKAWNKFNGKPIKEGYVRHQSEFGDTGLKYDDDYVDFEVGMTIVDSNDTHWKITKIHNNRDNDKVVWMESSDGQRKWDTQYNLNTDLMLDKIHMVYDSDYFTPSDAKYGSNQKLTETESEDASESKYSMNQTLIRNANGQTATIIYIEYDPHWNTFMYTLKFNEHAFLKVAEKYIDNNFTAEHNIDIEDVPDDYWDGE